MLIMVIVFVFILCTKAGCSPADVPAFFFGQLQICDVSRVCCSSYFMQKAWQSGTSPQGPGPGAYGHGPRRKVKNRKERGRERERKEKFSQVLNSEQLCFCTVALTVQAYFENWDLAVWGAFKRT